MNLIRNACALSSAIVLGIAPGAFSQTGGVPGGFKHDSTLPIQVSADALEVRQDDQVAVFTGTVDARQGDVRMQAQRLTVTYNPDADGNSDTGAIQRVRAEGDVFISGTDSTASGNWADYDVASGNITMGDTVTLTQGQGDCSNVIGGTSLLINLNTGRAQMRGGISGTNAQSGRVEMILNPGRGCRN